MLLISQTVVFLFSLKILLASKVAIPPPKGPYGVTSSTIALTNPNMLDPYDPARRHRRVMLSAFYPTARAEDCQQKRMPYMPPGTAAVYDEMYGSIGVPNGTFESLELTLCKRDESATMKDPPHCPVVLFSPGAGNSRLLYSATVAALAAQGFIVLTVDHPHDAAVVEFPDGSLIYAANISAIDEIKEAVMVRTKDVIFVIDQLHNRTVTKALFKGLYATMDPASILVYGHSLGGATAASATLEDNRIRGSINLDGSFFGPVVTEGLDRPFMLFAHEGKNSSNDESWGHIQPHLNSSSVEAEVLGTTHGSFTDLPLLADVLGLRQRLPAEEVAELIGTIKGKRMVHILTDYTRYFFEFVLGQPPSRLLNQSTDEFPEVVIVNSTLVRG